MIDHNVFELLREKRPAIYVLMARMVTLLLAKSHDYNEGAGDSYENLRSSKALGVPPWRGVLLRMSDKWSRLCSFAKTQTYKVKDESFIDTLLDMANYAILAVMDIEGEREDDDSE